MPEPIETIRVIIVEDHSIFIEGICSILQNAAGFSVSGSFTDGASALEFVGSHEVDVVLLDIGLPGMPGTEVCKAIKKLTPEIKIIALTNHAEKSVIVEMLQQGADGYLLKNTTRHDLLTAIEQVVNDQFTMNKELQKILFSAEKKAAGPPRLTRRELEVLQLVAEGITTAAIAQRLYISPQTVETHRHNLMQKFNVRNSAALIRKAGEYDLLKG